VSTHRKGDRVYWSNIYDNCFNKDVGSALYSYLREINTDKFQPQDYPITKNMLGQLSKDDSTKASIFFNDVKSIVTGIQEWNIE
jgi:hypothetical protein